MADEVCTNCGIKLTFSNTSLKNKNLCERCEKKLVNIQPTQSNNDLNKANVIDTSANNMKRGWNKLSIMALIFLLLPPICFLLILYITNLYNDLYLIPRYIRYSYEIARTILTLFLFFSPALALIFGITSFDQINKTKEKGDLVSLISIVFSIPLIIFMFFGALIAFGDGF